MKRPRITKNLISILEEIQLIDMMDMDLDFTLPMNLDLDLEKLIEVILLPTSHCLRSLTWRKKMYLSRDHNSDQIYAKTD